MRLTHGPREIIDAAASTASPPELLVDEPFGGRSSLDNPKFHADGGMTTRPNCRSASAFTSVETARNRRSAPRPLRHRRL